MSDIVERLRFHPADEDEVYSLFNEAADEIERLRLELERLRNKDQKMNEIIDHVYGIRT